MPERPFIFYEDTTSTEVVLPISPSTYSVDNGINIEIVNIHTLGDVILTGYGTLSTIKISFMLPARRYPFANDSDPGYYIDMFTRWSTANETTEAARLRFIVGNTGVNVPVVIESFAHGENDGTNDVYGILTIREYRNLSVAQFESSPSANKAREPVKKPEGEQLYNIVAGDTLSAICRKYYGDGSADTYNKLAAVNGISNPHLIYAGNTLKIPQPLP